MFRSCSGRCDVDQGGAVIHRQAFIFRICCMMLGIVPITKHRVAYTYSNRLVKSRIFLLTTISRMIPVRG
jgi:hypothetical protein